MFRFTSRIAAGLLLSAAVLTPGRSQPADEKPAEAAEPAKPADAAPASPPAAAEPSGGAGSASAPSAAPGAPPTTPGATPLPEIKVTIPEERHAAPKRAAKPRVATPGETTARPEPIAPSRVRTTAGAGQVTARRNRAAAQPGPAVAASPAEPGAPNMLQQPGGQPETTVTQDRVKASPAMAVDDLVLGSPGVTVKLGNGPRDYGISIRGSNARNGFGVRNIVMMEDGFPVTQPDGLSRTDLIDPHAYSGVDVWRGPSSALFGDYATGGAINFRLRRGSDINGFVTGNEGGSFGYLNNYFLMGGTSKGDNNQKFEGSLFASDVRGDGYISHFSFNTQTVNSLSTYSPTPDDRITFKFINNLLYTNLPIRLSLNQFQTNPFQSGCTAAIGAAPGCATINLFANGATNPAIAQTAQQAGLDRNDRRTIGGLRWEHDLNNATTWRSQIVLDDRNINQPTGMTSAVGDFPSYNIISDLTKKTTLLGTDATHYIGVYYNAEQSYNYTYNVAPGGNATLGAVNAYQAGLQENWGARAREEVKFNEYWTGLVGFAVERGDIRGLNTTFNYSSPSLAVTPVPITANRNFLNMAPEAWLAYQVTPDWRLRGRVATGYGTPNLGQLFVTPAGVPGNNTQLQTQTNLGYDVGVDWTPNRATKVIVTGFYELFDNEQITQSPGAGLMPFTFNIPHSTHRGIEVAVDWKPVPGWQYTMAYTYDNQYYTQFVEQLAAGSKTASLNRAGNLIPGVPPNELIARLGYDQPAGLWKGVGGFIEFQWNDSFYMDNANLLKAPGYEIVNLNLHYDKEVADSYIKDAIFFFEIKNLFDQTYVASANNISDSISSTTGLQNAGSVLAVTGTGSIYAGAPRTFIGGMKLAFR
jgi:iron complex outermembrane receptor protein